jgi:hypothetical protein
VAWARTPNHDAFWAYRGSLIAFIGRGKVMRFMLVAAKGASRVLQDCGYRVTAIDPVEAFILAAQQVGSADGTLNR